MGPVYNNVLCTDTTCARPSNAYPKVVIGRRRRSAAARSKSSRRRALSFRTKKKEQHDSRSLGPGVFFVCPYSGKLAQLSSC